MSKCDEIRKIHEEDIRYLSGMGFSEGATGGGPDAIDNYISLVKAGERGFLITIRLRQSSIVSASAFRDFDKDLIKKIIEPNTRRIASVIDNVEETISYINMTLTDILVERLGIDRGVSIQPIYRLERSPFSMEMLGFKSAESAYQGILKEIKKLSP